MYAYGGSDGRLVVCAEFAATEVVLGVREELDVASTPQLRAVSLAMVDGRHRQVVLDLAECGSVDAAGLRVIAETAEHLDVWGGHRFMIRSPSMAVRRDLDLIESNKLTVVDDPELVTNVVKGRAAFTRSAVTDRDDLGRQLGAVSALRAGRDDIDAALRLVALAQAVVGGADGVSVSVRCNGQLFTVAATDQTVLNMDTDQYATGEGPCVDASVHGQRFHAESLTNETRWPACVDVTSPGGPRPRQ